MGTTRSARKGEGRWAGGPDPTAKSEAARKSRMTPMPAKVAWDSQRGSCHVKDDCDEVGDASAENEEVEDAVAVGVLLVGQVEEDAGGIEKASDDQPDHARRAERPVEGGGRDQRHPSHQEVQADREGPHAAGQQ